MPVINVRRAGIQEGQAEYALVKVTPLRANCSRVGVITTGCPAGLVSSPLQWSVQIKRTLGRWSVLIFGIVIAIDKNRARTGYGAARRLPALLALWVPPVSNENALPCENPFAAGDLRAIDQRPVATVVGRVKGNNLSGVLDCIHE